MAEIGTVLAISGLCIKVAKQLNDVRVKYKSTDCTLLALSSECFVLHAALGRVQSIRLSHPGKLSRIQQGTQLADDFDSALTACTLTLSALSFNLDKMGSVPKGGGDSSKVNWKGKALYLWNETEMKDILSQLRGQQSALQLLLLALNLESMIEVEQILNLNQIVLRQLEKDASTNRDKKLDVGSSRTLRRRFTASILDVDKHAVLIPAMHIDGSIRDERTMSVNTNRDPGHISLYSTDDAIISANYPELMRFGLNYQDAINVFEKSGCSHRLVAETLKKWKSLGSDHDYSVMLNALRVNQFDIQFTQKGLMEIRSLGSDSDFSHALATLEKHNFNFILTIGRLKIIHGFGTKDDYPRALGALEGNGYNFQQTRDQLEDLQVKWGGRAYPITLRLLEANYYDLRRTQTSLEELQIFWGQQKDFERAIELLHCMGCDVKKTKGVLSELQELGSPLTFDTLLPLLEGSSYNLQSTKSFLKHLKSIYFDSPRSISVVDSLGVDDFREVYQKPHLFGRNSHDGSKIAKWLQSDPKSTMNTKISQLASLYALGRGDEDYSQSVDLLTSNNWEIGEVINVLTIFRGIYEAGDYSRVLIALRRGGWSLAQALTIVKGSISCNPEPYCYSIALVTLEEGIGEYEVKTMWGEEGSQGGTERRGATGRKKICPHCTYVNPAGRAGCEICTLPLGV